MHSLIMVDEVKEQASSSKLKIKVGVSVEFVLGSQARNQILAQRTPIATVFFYAYKRNKLQNLRKRIQITAYKGFFFFFLMNL